MVRRVEVNFVWLAKKERRRINNVLGNKSESGEMLPVVVSAGIKADVNDPDTDYRNQDGKRYRSRERMHNHCIDTSEY
jgi:hypothetical protein